MPDAYGYTCTDSDSGCNASLSDSGFTAAPLTELTLDLPFNFTFYGVQYDKIFASDRGIIVFDNVTSPSVGYSGDPIPSPGNYDHFIALGYQSDTAPVWQQINYKVSGQEPYREYIIRFFYTGVGTITFVTLFETTNRVSILYATPHSWIYPLQGNVTFGIEGSNGTSGIEIFKLTEAGQLVDVADFSICYNPPPQDVGTTGDPTTGDPTTGVPTTGDPTTGVPTTGVPTTGIPTTGVPTTGGSTTGTSGPPNTPPEIADAIDQILDWVQYGVFNVTNVTISDLATVFARYNVVIRTTSAVVIMTLDQEFASFDASAKAAFKTAVAAAVGVPENRFVITYRSGSVIAIIEILEIGSGDFDALVPLNYLGGDCDTAQFSLTVGCSLTQDYWATHYDGAGSIGDPNNIAWPGVDQCETCGESDSSCTAIQPPTICYDVFRSKTENSMVLYYLHEEYYATIPWCDPQTTCQEFCNLDSFFECSSGSLECTNSGPVAPLQVIKKGQTNQNTWCWVIGRQYIASLNNLCNGACYGYGGTSSEMFTAMQIAANFLFSEGCQNDPFNYNNASQSVQGASAVLEGYNNGKQIVVAGECELEYGPYRCEEQEDPTNKTCRPLPDGSPFDPCEGGCTHSQGYWKNHRLDSTSHSDTGNSVTPSWNEVCDANWIAAQDGVMCTDGVCTPLENVLYPLLPSSQLSWAGVQDASPKGGQACLIAAVQLIAAELNHNCGQRACLTDTVQNAIDQSKAIMTQYCADMTMKNDGSTTGGLRSSKNKPGDDATVARRRLLEYASYLELYNNGINVGPGRCEDIFDIIIEAAAEGETKENKPVYGALDYALLVMMSLLLLVGLVIICLIRRRPSNPPSYKPVYSSPPAASARMYGNRRPYFHQS
jgi:hypothetical protein